MRAHVLLAVLVLLGGCRSKSAPADAASHASVPAPAALADAASRFGLTMEGGGWTWTPMDERATRFQWSGRPASGDRELLVSFWMEKIGETEAKFLPQLVISAAMNLAEGRPCAAFEQPSTIVDALGFERVITVCFEPNHAYARGFSHGVMHGIVHKGALTILVVLSDSPSAAVPAPATIAASPKRDPS